MTTILRTVEPTVEPIRSADVAAHVRLDSFTLPPTTAPTVALVSPDVAGNVDDGAHRYRVTFVTADGETDGGPISSAITVADKTVSGQVALTAIPTGDANVTARKLYRTAAGGSDYLLLATISNNTTTTYTDNIADASLGAGIPVANGTLPDVVIPIYIKAARRNAEHKYLHRALLEQTWQLTIDAFPTATIDDPNPEANKLYTMLDGARVKVTDGLEIHLPMPRLIAITSIAYVDADGADQTLSSDDYVICQSDDDPFLLPADEDAGWPETADQRNAVTITYTCGYGDSADDVPDDIKAGLLLLVADLYRNREAQTEMNVELKPNPTVVNLFEPHAIRGNQWLIIA